MGDLTTPPLSRSPGRIAAIIAGACVIAALITSTQLYVPKRLGEPGTRPWVVLGFELFEWAMWGLVAPVIWRIDARWGFRARSWPRALALHLVIAFAWFLVHNAIMVGSPDVPESGYMGMTFGQAYALRFVARLPSALSVYAAIVAAGYWAWWLAAHHRQQAQRAQLEAQLAAARLRALRMQLQPHFLFNTLHTIAGHVREGERDTAVDLIARLSRLLRRSLDEAERHEVPLAEEIELLAEYLALERARFGDALVTRFDIAPDVRDLAVPSLILQPLVENALRHGIGPREGPGELRIAARRDNGHLVLEIADDGVGYDPARAGAGVGLANTRERLTQLYGDRQRFEIGRGVAGGTVARVEIPLPEAQRNGG
ncbi:MAG: sensor histidine kinase [Gemmatimonadales bacterium]